MSEAVSLIFSNTDYFVLVLLRVGGLVISSPVFGRTQIPAKVKIGLSAALAYLFFVLIPPPAQIVYDSLIGFALICISEILIGIALAFVTNVFFALNYVAGQLIDMQIGFGIVNVYDPQNNTQIPMMGNLLNMIMLIVFFAVNGHQRLIQIVYITAEKLPVGNLVFSPDTGLVALEIFSMSFVLGVMVALPVIASALVMEIGFGALIRTVPQINMFVIGIPTKLLVGLIVMLFLIPGYVSFTDRIFDELFLGIEKMFSVFMVAS